MKLFLAWRTIAVAIVIALGASAAQAAEMSAHEEELYAAAKKEGSIVWYVSQFGTQESDRVCQIFNKQYPGVSCNAVRTSGQGVFQRLMQEIQAKAVHADVMSSNDDTEMVLLKRANALGEYKPDNQRAQPQALIDAGNGGWWSITSVSPLGLAINTNLVKPDEAPKNWTDMYDPKWRNQVAIGDPDFSGSVGVWTVAMKQLYRWDFFEKLAANGPQLGRSIVDGVSLVESGERKISLAPLVLAANDGLHNGKPVKAVYPNDGVVLPPSPSAIMKDAPHPNAAKLFIEFLLSKEFSELFLRASTRWPIRTDVAPPEGLPALNEIKIITVATEQVMQELRDVQRQFRDTFGI